MHHIVLAAANLYFHSIFWAAGACKVAKRERINSTREVAPFIKAEDAILIDSTNMTIEEVVNRVIEIIDEKKAN